MIIILLRTIVAVIAIAFVLDTPPAYAIFGIRAARTVMAARKAKQAASSDSDADKAYAEEKARFGEQAGREGGAGRDINNNTSNIPESEERP
jgi:hypothetical protein